MTKKEHKAERIDLKALVGGDRDFLRELIRTTLQEVLEAEMTEALGAGKGERTAGRCVQRRLARSVGDNPTKAKASSLVAWMAGRRETNDLKPID